MRTQKQKQGIVVAYDFENRIERLTNRIRKLKNKHNSEKILEHNKCLAANGLAIPTQHKYLDRLHTFAQWLNKDFEKVTREDMIKIVDKYITKNKTLSDGTKNLYIKIIKKFYQWLYTMEEGDYPDSVRWMKTIKDKGNNHKKPEDMLNDEDIEKMINAVEHPRDKAFLITLAESGCRIGELLTLTIGSIIFDNRGAYFLVSGKTGTRRVRVVNSTPFLHTWLSHHPLKKDKDSPLWVTIGNMKDVAMQKVGGENSKNYKLDWSLNLTYAAARKLILKAGEKAGITKPINPHNFRHSRATALAGSINESVMNEIMGWRQGSKMAGVYTHMNGKQVDDALLPAIYGMEVKEEKDKHPKMFPIKCISCGELNPYDAKRCQKCNSIIGVITKEDINEGKLSKEVEKLKEVVNLLVAKGSRNKKTGQFEVIW